MRFYLMVINFVQDFAGNKDRHTIVFHKLRAFFARFIRILPRSWHGHVSMRTELYGCPGIRTILYFQQSLLPQGTVNIHGRGGEGGNFGEDHIVFRANRRGGGVSRRLQSIERILQEIDCQYGGLQEYCRALKANTPPLPPPKPRH